MILPRLLRDSWQILAGILKDSYGFVRRSLLNGFFKDPQRIFMSFLMNSWEKCLRDSWRTLKEFWRDCEWVLEGLLKYAPGIHNRLSKDSCECLVDPQGILTELPMDTQGLFLINACGFSENSSDISRVLRGLLWDACKILEGFHMDS